MGWNEPSGGNNDKDPWGRGNRGNGDRPPDLDEIIRKMQEGIGGIFGRKPSTSGRGGNENMPFLLIGILAVLIVWSMWRKRI